MLHTLFQTSIKYPSIKRFDEYFCTDLMVEDGRCQGVLVIEIATGEFTLIQAKAVIIATGGAGRVFRENTNGGIVTGDGMALAYRHGVPLRDMEFMQYHPTCMPRTGLLFTEACRGEGGIPAEQGRIPLPAGLRTWTARGQAAQQVHGTGSARPAEPGVLARATERQDHRRTVWLGGEPGPAPPRRSLSARTPAADLRTGGRVHGHRSGAYADPGRAGRALHHGRNSGRRQDGFVAAGPVFGRRMLQRRHPRRQPAGLELA